MVRSMICMNWNIEYQSIIIMSLYKRGFGIEFHLIHLMHYFWQSHLIQAELFIRFMSCAYMKSDDISTWHLYIYLDNRLNMGLMGKLNSKSKNILPELPLICILLLISCGNVKTTIPVVYILLVLSLQS